MKVRHAAALALVGWYLITPPWKPDAHGWKHPAPKAPFVEWYFEPKERGSWEITRKYAKIFASQRECEEKIEEYKLSSRAFRKRFDNHEHVPDWMFDGIQAGDYELSARTAQCIATDDPRLKVRVN